ncbi:uncharacterized protein LOC112569588 isoform X2 [Pomacea canaliculata]|uniref:uncharacterized protein LOC112569588 isoform X2 n=1 Tax=Pomacea canaliculata TaxID=400727 RepID=UPI000D728449|nr:uncharacterized protein LOC112569588 isoform X2 [Pomacea canaliculata]
MSPFCQECNATEVSAIETCISPYKAGLSSFGTGGTCNRNLITQDVCNSYGNIVTCVNRASLSTTTCRPYMIPQMDAKLGISCKVSDFIETCTSAPKLNTGSGAASFLRSTGASAILVAMATHVILAVFALPVRNS